MENLQSEGEKHGAGDGLNGKLDVGSDRTDVIANAEQKNYKAGQENAPQAFEGGDFETQVRSQPANEQRQGQAEQESEENGNAAKTWQRAMMQVAI
jgi:diphthamide synthase (EF-2-diphthine--ammonia ligase)